MCGEFAEANIGGRNEAISLIDRKMPPKAFDSVGKHSNTETEIFDEKLFFTFNIFSKRFVTVCPVPGDGHHSCVVRRLLRQKKAFSPQRRDWCKTGGGKHHHHHASSSSLFNVELFMYPAIIFITRPKSDWFKPTKAQHLFSNILRFAS